MMIAIASIVTNAAGVSWADLPIGYSRPALAVCLVFLVGAVFLHLVRMAIRLEDNPVRGMIQFASDRSQLLILPAIITPLFLAGFTASKTAMAHLVGFGWDGLFTRMDAALFGADPWRWTHAVIGDNGTAAMGFFYTLIWGFTLAFSKTLIAIYGSRRFIGTVFFAMSLTWLIAGFFLAYLFTSTGPVFVHLIDPELGQRFAPLLQRLDEALPADASVRATQSYLSHAIFTTQAVKGGGISAMPSMHIGASVILFLAARGTLWVWPAALFLALTWIGSVHLGYHYAIDAVPAAIVAVLCWQAAAVFYSRPAYQRGARDGAAATARSEA